MNSDCNSYILTKENGFFFFSHLEQWKVKDNAKTLHISEENRLKTQKPSI